MRSGALFCSLQCIIIHCTAWDSINTYWKNNEFITNSSFLSVCYLSSTFYALKKAYTKDWERSLVLLEPPVICPVYHQTSGGPGRWYLPHYSTFLVSDEKGLYLYQGHPQNFRTGQSLVKRMLLFYKKLKTFSAVPRVPM